METIKEELFEFVCFLIAAILMTIIQGTILLIGCYFIYGYTPLEYL